MGRVVNLLGCGGQRFAEQDWDGIVAPFAKVKQELQTGQSIKDGFNKRGRRRAEDHLPHLLDDIRAIVEPVGANRSDLPQ